MRVKPSDLLLAVPLALTLLVSAPHIAYAADGADPTYDQEEESACNEKQQDLIKKANKNMRMPDKTNEMSPTDQTRNSAVGAFTQHLGSTGVPTQIFGALSGAITGGMSSFFSQFAGGANGAAPQQQLVRQNQDSCKSKKRQAQVHKNQDPRDSYGSQPAQAEKY
jgi:hypothetical protein